MDQFSYMVDDVFRITYANIIILGLRKMATWKLTIEMILQMACVGLDWNGYATTQLLLVFGIWWIFSAIKCVFGNLLFQRKCLHITQ